MACPSSSATRAASARAARRRGWVWAITPATPRPSSRQYCGSCVLLPEPVSPATMSTCRSLSARWISSRRAVIGRSGSYLNVSTDAARAATRRCARSFVIGLLTALDGLPKTLLRRKIQFAKDLAALRGERLHGAEAAFELGVGGSQRRFGIDIEFARQVRRGKQQVTDLFEDFRRSTCSIGRVARRCAYFGELLLDF